MRRFHQYALAVIAIASASSSVTVAAAKANDDAPASELRRLVTLSRHGSRAPNGVVARICPNNIKNLDAYHVPLEQLTEFGMEQMVAVGEHVRQVYVHDKQFLSPTLNGPTHTHFESYFRSDSATRCSQSATALGFGLYPDGTGPAGFPREPVPVTMQLLKNEHEFAAPKGPCKATLGADNDAYAKTRVPELLAQYKSTLDTVSALCGVDLHSVATMPGGEDSVLAVKDIADMFIFDRQQNLTPLAGLTKDVSTQLETLAFTNLMERYYSTDRTITYWNGGFPDLLLKNLFDAATPASPVATDHRYFSYHGHRELLHSMGKLLGWSFDFEGLPKALNMTSLHPATTMFFELHARNATGGKQDGEEEYFVQTFVWSPNSEREQVTLSKCSSRECPLAEFEQIIKSYELRTGTWQEICSYKDASQQNAHLVASGGEDDPSSSSSGSSSDAWDSAFLIVLCAMVALGLVFGIVNAVLRMRNFRRSSGYRSI